ncbi:hypothetical protein NL676_036823 [Syzygium grande]|nr:hypothetical protein NL676_036823 [Syzygium grande]
MLFGAAPARGNLEPSSRNPNHTKLRQTGRGAHRIKPNPRGRTQETVPLSAIDSSAAGRDHLPIRTAGGGSRIRRLVP